MTTKKKVRTTGKKLKLKKTTLKDLNAKQAGKDVKAGWVATLACPSKGCPTVGCTAPTLVIGTCVNCKIG